MAELGSTSDPVALVPGDPAAVRAQAAQLRSRAAQLETAASALSRVRVPGWRGEAADAFQAVLDKQPRSWRATADALGSGASALEGYADALAGAQADAARAISAWAEGEAATAEARRAHDARVAEHAAAAGAGIRQPGPGPFVDPGGALRREGSATLDDARAAVADAGDAAAERLGEIVVSDSPIVRNDAGWSGPGISGSVDGSAFSIDPTTGELTFWKAEGTASLFSGDATTRATYGSWFAGAEAHTMLGAKGEAVLGVEDGTFRAGVEGSAGLHGDVVASAGGEHGEVKVTGSAFAGVHAEAGVDLSTSGVSANAGAFAGARAEAGASAEVAGVGGGATVEGWAGVGAEADAVVGRTPEGAYKVRVKAGAAYGLGGSLGFEVTVDPDGVVDAAEDAAEFVGGLFE